ncbi:hypothetical protein sscle_13g092280 [Sclerotinia sclerotiorum 1980 UF-70]|uniref:Uncharacterized protein n=1 Tax=Sclerotinia sclerotiorum (strain ATCC 18683 / 1980 / Ss-1) TaxID=665079 RepID=A0A1D9QHR6_SCLS1|nr:hypothetical protein sscle_13g092280 [Sclerotinia sclerotiorum 1980 UF-70]
MSFQNNNREHGAGDLKYDADTESKKPHKARRKVDRNSNFTPQIFRNNQYMGSATPSPRKVNRVYYAEPLFSNPIQEYVNTNRQEDIQSDNQRSDGSSTTENDNLATPDFTSDDEDEERIASIIIQRSRQFLLNHKQSNLTKTKGNENSDGGIKPSLPGNLIVKIFESMIRSPQNLENSSITRNSEQNVHKSTHGEDADSNPSTNNAFESVENEEDDEAGKNNGGMIDAICFALTCLRYWTIFRGIWCYPGTNRILGEFKLSMTQQLTLASLLKKWIGPDYRRSNLLTFHSYAGKNISSDGSHGYISMFLARKVYGRGYIKKNTRKELSLWRRYKAQSQILDCSGQHLEDFMPSTDNRNWRAELPKVQLLSPFGMGTTWYFAAAKQYRDMFTTWKFEYSDCFPLGANHSNAMILSWGSFMKTSIYRWVQRYKAPVNISIPSMAQRAMERSQVVEDIIQLEEDIIQDLAIDHVFRGEVWGLFPRDEFPADEYGEHEMRTMFRAIMMGDDQL